MRFLRFALGSTALMALAVWLLPAAASATFPGKNGRIAFVQGVNSPSGGSLGDIFSVKPDGKDVKRLTNFAKDGASAFLRGWSPDGKLISFTYVAPSSIFGQLWLMNADGSNKHLVFSENHFTEDGATFSPDGKRLVFERCGPDGDRNCAIYRINVNGTGLTALTKNNPETYDDHPAYSPDGRTIAFTGQRRDGVLAAIYLMNDDGSNVRRLTPPDLMAWSPDWKPSARAVAFSSDFVLSTFDEDIYTIDLDRQLERLTDNNIGYHGYLSGAHDYYPSWAPEGNAIVFERDSPHFKASTLYIMNADGTGMHPILEGLTPAPRLRHLLNSGIAPRWGAAS